MKKRILILGSTGTIGINTLKVIEQFSDRFEIVGLTAYNNIDVLAAQVRAFRPKYVAVSAEKKEALQQALGNIGVIIRDAVHDLVELCSLNEWDIVVIGISGRAALEPFLACARTGKVIAPANKEALVIAGHLLMAQVKRSGARIVPVDSEQSAIFQCLEGQHRSELKKVYLTASGGALRDVPAHQFGEMTVEKILNHPRWKMGKKITVDSALMMNKGFEIIEAQRLFGLDIDQIEVVVHPQAIVHSMVCFQDGSILAQLGETDMRLPIQYALTYPQRWPSAVKELNLFDVGKLTFERPDEQKFPALALARAVAREGGTLPSVLNAADEEAVEAFLDRRIRFNEINEIVADTVGHHQKGGAVSLEEIVEADVWARSYARALIARCQQKKGIVR